MKTNILMTYPKRIQNLKLNKFKKQRNDRKSLETKHHIKLLDKSNNKYTVIW